MAYKPSKTVTNAAQNALRRPRPVQSLPIHPHRSNVKQSTLNFDQVSVDVLRVSIAVLSCEPNARVQLVGVSESHEKIIVLFQPCHVVQHRSACRATQRTAPRAPPSSTELGAQETKTQTKITKTHPCRRCECRHCSFSAWFRQQPKTSGLRGIGCLAQTVGFCKPVSQDSEPPAAKFGNQA